jgi:DNA-binding NtrC family response regulator
MSEPGRHIRLLIVDDELDYLHVLQKRLAKRGLEVVTAGSGSQAIQMLRDHQFEVAVLDLKMQDMDGIEVLKIFKKMDPRLEVIMLTGHGSEQAARDGIALGAFDYLTKPCDLEVLFERIQAAAAAQAAP